MIYSKSSQYAIRSVSYLAVQPKETLCRLENIATNEGIPRHFLAKIMQRLVKKRLVRSSKGINGGFCLSIPAEKVTLYMIVDAIDDVALSINDCILGRGSCSEDTRCSLHEYWKGLRTKQIEFLHNVTVADIAALGKRTGSIEERSAVQTGL